MRFLRVAGSEPVWDIDRATFINPSDVPDGEDVAPVQNERRISEIAVAMGRVGPVVLVPASVTLYQGRAALIQAGLFDQVKAAVDAQGPNSLAFQAFEYANHWYRDSEFVAHLAGGLSLTDEIIDDLFIAAAGL